MLRRPKAAREAAPRLARKKSHPQHLTVGPSNVGYTTENSGAAIIDAESTFVLVEHGLDLTPIDGDVVVVPTNSMGNSTKFYVGSYGATQFRITVDQAPGAETAAFAWRAEIRR